MFSRLRRPSRTVDPAGPSTPLLSVVVPVHGTEAYVEECLASIAAQPVSDHEVVVVDDGSPDRAADLVRRRARRDPRVRLVQQDNAGLGAARNAGVATARGRYLAFVDSDDVLPPDAWGPMLASLESSGSDFAVGRAERDDGTRRWATPLMQRNHATALTATDVARSPLLLADVFAWNKLFRRDFWDAHDLAFPVGVRYEDQPALTAAFLAARSFDVLTETVYRWRVRGDGSSISQQRHRVADLRDRLETKRDSLRQVRDAAGPTVLEVFCADVLPVDMWEYFRAAPEAGEEFWRLLVDGVRELWHDGTLPFAATRVPPQQRLMGWFVEQDRPEGLRECLAWIDAHRPLPLADGVLEHPWRDEPGMPTLRQVPA